MSLSVAAVWRYPIKGLGGEFLPAAEILPRRGIAGDRRWLLASAKPGEVAGLLSGEQAWRPWNYGLTLKKHPQLAALRASLRGEILTMQQQNGETISCDMAAEDGRAAADEFLRAALKDDSVYLADCESRPAWDDETPLTVLFSATVSELSEKCGAVLAAARFRANIVVDGGNARDELARLGAVLQLGAEVKLKIEEGVERCAATRVNPKTAARDMNVPESLVRHYGHNMMGVHCRVVCGGELVAGASAAWQ